MARNGSVLVVDDEEIMREILEALLTREGYQVRLASSGEEFWLPSCGTAT